MNHKNKNKIIITILFISFLIFNFNSINAQTAPETNYAPLNDLKTIAEDNVGYSSAEQNSIRTITAKIVQSILSLLGIIFLILIIISGYQWMTAGGNEESIAKAKKRIINATIGVAIVILAYSIHVFVIEMLLS